MASLTREQKEAKLTALATELALALYLRSDRESQPLKELASITGLTPGTVAGLVATGRRLWSE